MAKKTKSILTINDAAALIGCTRQALQDAIRNERIETVEYQPDPMIGIRKRDALAYRSRAKQRRAQNGRKGAPKR